MIRRSFLSSSDRLELEAPRGYRRVERPRRPTLDAYIGVIDEILRTDKSLIKKQRHTAKRIFERLRDEHRYAGSQTTVAYYVREQKRRTKEVFVPLSHRPGHVLPDRRMQSMLPRGHRWTLVRRLV